MKVKDIPYEHLSFDKLEKDMKDIISKVKNANSADDILSIRKEYDKVISHYMTMHLLSYIRYSCNTADEFYVKENDYYDEIGPKFEELDHEYGNALLDSPYREDLEKKLSPVYFKYLEIRRKSMSSDVVEDMVEENKIVTEYSKLMAGMEFEFNGEKMSRAKLSGFFRSEDRNIRRRAYEEMGNVMLGYKDQLDDIYDRLVKIRTKIAQKMGYKNYVELGYNRMERVSYGAKEIQVFRENVKKYLVPVVSKLRTENAKKLGIDNYMLYDDGIIINGGDPKPCGGKEDIFAAAKKMYHDMGKETGEFIDLMLLNDAFDVDARENKWGGGYEDYIQDYRQPFILANFNGTADDVDVVTHEAGHALNSFLDADNEFSLEIGCGGMETAETHSMSMEFFAWKYMDLFFGEKANDYKFMHALAALSFIPYGTIVDYFQQQVYENPEMTPAERNELWKSLEKEFRPYISVDGMPFLEEGRRWQYQMHIYELPFYYIDYCLAQTAAFGFLIASLENYDDAFKKYINLSKQGGEKYFEDLLKEAEIPSPFKEGALKEMAEKVGAIIAEIKS